MMKSNFLLILCIGFVTKAASQDLLSLGLNGLKEHDFKNHRNITSVSLNGYFIYLNYGAEYRFNSRLSPSKRNDEIAFIGVGYYNWYQFQLGRSTAGITYIRQRTDWTLSELGVKWKGDAWDNPFEGITISAYIDKSVSDSRQSWIVGIGIGYSIRATGILH